MRLGGFQPPRLCSESKRLPYAPEWSVKALLEMMNLLQQKGVFRALITVSLLFDFMSGVSLIHTHPTSKELLLKL